MNRIPAPLRPRLLPVAVALALAGGPAVAQDTPSLDEMWEMIQAQQAQIEALQEQNAELVRQVEAARAKEEAEAAAEAAQAEAFVGAIVEGEAMEEPPKITPVPEPEAEGEWNLNIYGHAMLDMGYQTKQSDPDWFDVVRPTKLPSFDNEFGDDGSWFSSVRQSRFGVKSRVPTRYGDLNTLFEFELFGVGADAGQTTFRLRHAWGELGRFGAGQTWSTFMDIDVFPNSIEYWGPSGMIFYRNIQARWTPWSTDSGSRFAIALEQPGGSGDEGRLSDLDLLNGVRGDFELPDLAAHYRVVGDWGHVQAAGILREIRWVDTTPGEFDFSGDELGWGVNLSTNINLGRHVFRGSLTYGEGIQNYFNDAAADIGVALRADRPELPIEGEAIPVLGLVAFLDLNWSDRWTSTIGYSLQDNDLPDLAADTSFERGQYALANLLYHPVPNVLLGPELQWAKRNNYGPFSSDDFRVQFSAKWNFNYLISGN
jgi:hypothetical protein